MTITNRELLRNYKQLKEKLVHGDIEEIRIPQKTGIVIKIIAQRECTPFERMTKRILEKPFKNLKRPDEDVI